MTTPTKEQGKEIASVLRDYILKKGDVAFENLIRIIIYEWEKIRS